MEKKLHQIWVGDNPMPEREQGLCKLMQDMHSSYEYRLWTDETMKHEQLPSNVQLCYDQFYKERKFAFCADLLRVWVIYTAGGFYFDVDFEMYKPMDDFLSYDGMLLHHEAVYEHGEMPNGVFGGKRGLEVLKYCLDNAEWWNGPSWFGTKIKKYLGLSNTSTNESTISTLQEVNIISPCWEEWHGVYAHHHSLYSWSDNYVPVRKNVT